VFLKSCHPTKRKAEPAWAAVRYLIPLYNIHRRPNTRALLAIGTIPPAEPHRQRTATKESTKNTNTTQQEQRQKQPRIQRQLSYEYLPNALIYLNASLVKEKFVMTSRKRRRPVHP